MYTRPLTGAARRRSGELLSERAGEVGKSLLKFLNERLELRLRLSCQKLIGLPQVLQAFAFIA